jgi:hypothetical protein
MGGGSAHKNRGPGWKVPGADAVHAAGNDGRRRGRPQTTGTRRGYRESLADALGARAPEMPPNRRQQPTTATSGNLRT